MLRDTKNYVLVASDPGEDRTEIEELLNNPEVKVLESVENRFWRLSMPVDMARELRARLRGLRLEEEKNYPAPQSHPAKQRSS
jgi:hypothetical protein